VLVGALRIQGQKFSPPCDAKGGFRRIEVLTSPARRRQWSGAEKDRIVAETQELGASVSAALPSSASGGFEPDFVAIVAETASTTIAVETTDFALLRFTSRSEDLTLLRGPIWLVRFRLRCDQLIASVGDQETTLWSRRKTPNDGKAVQYAPPLWRYYIARLDGERTKLQV
jgi:hypothetical protein